MPGHRPSRLSRRPSGQLPSRRAGLRQASGRRVRQADSRESRRRRIDRPENPRTRLAAGRLRRGAKLGRSDDLRQVAAVSETRFEVERRLGRLAVKFRARQLRPRAVGANHAPRLGNESGAASKECASRQGRGGRRDQNNPRERAGLPPFTGCSASEIRLPPSPLAPPVSARCLAAPTLLATWAGPGRLGDRVDVCRRHK